MTGPRSEVDAAEERAAGAELPPGFEMVASLAELVPGSLLAVRLGDGTPICLANSDGEVLALHDCCSHQAFPLSAGELHEDGTVECTWHGALFDLHTGEPLEGPACDRVRTFEVRVLDGMVHVRGDRREA